MRVNLRLAFGALVAAMVTWAGTPGASTKVTVPLECNRGPSGQHSELSVTVPATVPEKGTLTVRIDGFDSGKISHTGLNHIKDMTTEVLIPPGTTYVSGSAKIVAGTGSQNVQAGAKVTVQGDVVAMVLPAKVQSGSRYTPPSFEFQVKVSAPGGAKVVQRFNRYAVTANAFLVGDLRTTCDPKPKPYVIGTTSVTNAQPAPQ